MTRMIVYAGLALGLTLAAPRAARAGLSTEQKQEARKTYERAVTHYNLGEFGDAAEDFKAVYKLVGEPNILYNIAQSYRFANNAERAVFFYQSFLNAMPAAPNRATIEKRIKELSEKTPAPSTTTTPAVTPVKHETKPEVAKPEVKPEAKPEAKPAVAGTGGSERLKPVVEIIKANRQGFRDCFDKWSKANPGKGGKVTLVFFLDPDGVVGQADADTTGFESPEVSACIVAHARTLSYPTSMNGKFTRIAYPFDFKAR